MPRKLRASQPPPKNWPPLPPLCPPLCLLACRLALDQLAPTPPLHVAFVSLSGSPSAASQAAELGCGTCEHLPSRAASPAQLQAWAMQAVARQARQARQAAGLQPPLVVGYVMKVSRQLALAQQGMLPLLPAAEAGAEAGGAGSAAAPAALEAAAAVGEGERPVCFVPLDLHSPLAPQLSHCDIVLQASGVGTACTAGLLGTPWLGCRHACTASMPL